MDDPPRPTGNAPTEAEPPRAPRWVKVTALVALVAALLIGALLLFGGDHGPRRHFSADGLVTSWTVTDGRAHAAETSVAR